VARADEVADVLALLLEHANPALPADQQRAMARRIAVGTLGDLHLWEDLGLASRAELGALMQHHFPALVAANAAGMRWKKFIHRALCQRAEILICRSPTCAACDEQAVCFGPED
jgi:nitrogen fixation protein NifQ